MCLPVDVAPDMRQWIDPELACPLCLGIGCEFCKQSGVDPDAIPHWDYDDREIDE
jgi:hypothetical protein